MKDEAKGVVIAPCHTNVKLSEELVRDYVKAYIKCCASYHKEWRCKEGWDEIPDNTEYMAHEQYAQQGMHWCTSAHDTLEALGGFFCSSVPEEAEAWVKDELRKSDEVFVLEDEWLSAYVKAPTTTWEHAVEEADVVHERIGAFLDKHGHASKN